MLICRLLMLICRCWWWDGQRKGSWNAAPGWWPQLFNIDDEPFTMNLTFNQDPNFDVAVKEENDDGVAV